jgi:hypothetical protein
VVLSRWPCSSLHLDRRVLASVTEAQRANP